MESVQDILKSEYQLSFPLTSFNLVVHESGNIVDRVTFDFDPQYKPEKGRVRFVYTPDHIQTLVDNGENLEVEFKGYKNLNFSLDDLIETIYVTKYTSDPLYTYIRPMTTANHRN